MTHPSYSTSHRWASRLVGSPLVGSLLVAALLCAPLLSGCYASHSLSSPSPDGGTGCLPRAATVHREIGATCDRFRAPGSTPEPGPPADCSSDADCTALTNGRCNGNSHDGWRCTYDACFTDSDCGPDNACQCSGGFRADNNVCVTGNCRTDADCATGFCSPTLGSCGDYVGTVGWFCHTCDDTCVNDADCAGLDGGFFGAPYCAFDPVSGRWGCQNTHCVG